MPYDPVETSKENRIKWAFVYVKKGLEGKSFEAPKEAAQLSFDRFVLKPRILGIMAGQTLLVTNKEAWVHAAHVMPFVDGNKETNDILYKDQQAKRTFVIPEIGIIVLDDRHRDIARARVNVVPHPYYCVTGENGEYRIKGLPPGKYTLEAWQENCGPVTQEIELVAKESKAVDFALEVIVRAHLFISGRVQGVGFRASTEEEARRIGDLVGWVKNLADGRVEAVLQGPRDKVEKLVQWCRKGPSTAEVTNVERKDEPFANEFKTFEVRY